MVVVRVVSGRVFWVSCSRAPAADPPPWPLWWLLLLLQGRKAGRRCFEKAIKRMAKSGNRLLFPPGFDINAIEASLRALQELSIMQVRRARTQQRTSSTRHQQQPRGQQQQQQQQQQQRKQKQQQQLQRKQQ